MLSSSGVEGSSATVKCRGSQKSRPVSFAFLLIIVFDMIIQKQFIIPNSDMEIATFKFKLFCTAYLTAAYIYKAHARKSYTQSHTNKFAQTFGVTRALTHVLFVVILETLIHWSIEIPGSRPPGVCGDYASSALLMT